MVEGSGRRSATGSAVTRRRLTIGGTALVAIGLVVALLTVDVEPVVDAVVRADPWVLGLATVVYAASWPLRGRRYDDVLGAMGYRGGPAFLTMTVFASQTANLVVPARTGDAVRAYLVKRHRAVPYPSGFASLAIERVFDLLAVAALAVGALAAFVAAERPNSLRVAAIDGGGPAVRVALAVASAAVVLAVGVGLVARSDSAVGSTLRARVAGRPRVRRVVDWAVRFAGDVGIVVRDRRALAVIGAGSLLVWAIDALTAVLVLAAFGTDLGAETLLVAGTLAVSVGNLVKVVPLSQGGIGLYEAAFTGLIVGLTPIGAATALGAAIVDHALKNAVTLVGGGLSFAAFDVSPSEARDRTAGPETEP